MLFDDNLKTSLISFFIVDFNLLNSELDSFIFCFFNIKNIVVSPAISKFFSRINFLNCSRIIIKSLMFVWLCCNRFVIFFEARIIQPKTSCVISLTSSDFSNIFICFIITVYWLKKIAINFWHCSLLFIILEDNFLNVMFYHLYFRQTIQKIHLFLENIVN